LGYCGNKQAAREVGKLVAQRALANGIKRVVLTEADIYITVE